MSNFGNMSIVERQEIIELAALTATQTALKVYEKTTKQAKIKRSDMRLHRTDLLMKNYRALYNHCLDAVSEKRKIKDCAIDILDEIEEYIDDELYIESIKKSAQRTIIIVSHVQKMLDIYQILAEKSKDPIQLRRFTAMYMRYVDETIPTIQRISEHLKIDRSVVYDDINIAFQTFGPLLFGIDSLKIK